MLVRSRYLGYPILIGMLALNDRSPKRHHTPLQLPECLAEIIEMNRPRPSEQRSVAVLVGSVTPLLYLPEVVSLKGLTRKQCTLAASPHFSTSQKSSP